MAPSPYAITVLSSSILEDATTTLFSFRKVSNTFIGRAAHGPKSVTRVSYSLFRMRSLRVHDTGGVRVRTLAEDVLEATSNFVMSAGSANRLGYQMANGPQVPQKSALYFSRCAYSSQCSQILSRFGFVHAPCYCQSPLDCPAAFMTLPIRLTFGLDDHFQDRQVCALSTRRRLWRVWRFKRAPMRLCRRTRRFLTTGAWLWARSTAVCTALTHYVCMLHQVLSVATHRGSATGARGPSASIGLRPMQRFCLCLRFHDATAAVAVPSHVPSTAIVSSLSWQRKRAYNRACRRAAEKGSTTYRGKPFHLHPSWAHDVTSGHQPKKTTVSASTAKRRFRVVTWNCGGGGGECGV